MKAIWTVLAIGMATVVAVAVVAWLIIKPSRPQASAPQKTGPPAEIEQAKTLTSTPAPTPTPIPEAAPETQAAQVSASAPPPQTAKSPPPQAVPKPAKTKKPKEPLQDPLAREAMALVGMDREAEAYWFDAINDPGISNNEREDLIEDLNENGFSGDNGRRATVEDLPLVVRRLLIVEELWPYAMDENNWKAFQEVHKDLSNMYARLTER